MAIRHHLIHAKWELIYSWAGLKVGLNTTCLRCSVSILYANQMDAFSYPRHRIVRRAG